MEKLLLLLFSFLSLSLTNCGKDDKKDPPATQVDQPQNANEYAKVDQSFGTFIQKQEVWATGGSGVDVTWKVDVKAMKQSGLSDKTIQDVQELYSELTYNSATYGEDGNSYGKIKYAVKAVKWITQNWNRILNRMPPRVKNIVVKWVAIDRLSSLLDHYLKFSDKIETIITNAVNDILPWWMRWSTPAIVWVITTAIPVL